MILGTQGVIIHFYLFIFMFTCVYQIKRLAGSLVSEKYISKPCWLVCKIEQVASIMHGYSFYSDNGFLLRVFTKGFYYEILIMTCSKSVKMTNYYDLLKVSKMTILIMTSSKLAKWLLSFLTCSKLAKWLIIMTCSKLAVLNKAIQGDFFKSQKGKNRLINYGFLFN